MIYCKPCGKYYTKRNRFRHYKTPSHQRQVSQQRAIGAEAEQDQQSENKQRRPGTLKVEKQQAETWSNGDPQKNTDETVNHERRMSLIEPCEYKDCTCIKYCWRK